MWKKGRDPYLEEVLFWSDEGGDFRALVFSWNQCVDSRYASMSDRQGRTNPKSRTVLDLKQNFDAFIAESKDFDDSKPLEALIHHGDHNLTIPAEYLK
jgi:hypothetical protein